MDNESKQALRLLEGMAAGNEKLIAFTRFLRARPEVVEVFHEFEIRNLLLTGPMIDIYADARLHDKGICWWLEVNWTEEEWVIESRVTITDQNRDGSSRDIYRFSDRPAKTIDEFLRQFEEAISELIDSFPTIDLFNPLEPSNVLKPEQD